MGFSAVHELTVRQNLSQAKLASLAAAPDDERRAGPAGVSEIVWHGISYPVRADRMRSSLSQVTFTP